MKALSVGLPGRLKSSFTLLRCAHSSSTFEINSLPLSTLIVSGKPQLSFSLSSTSTTRLPVNQKSTSMAGLIRLKLSTNESIRILRRSESRSMTKSILQHSFGEVTAGSATRGSLTRFLFVFAPQTQTFLLVESGHSLAVDLPAFAHQKHVQPPLAVAHACRR